MKQTLTALALTLACLHSHADWTPFVTLEDGTWFLDHATRTQDPQPRVWTLFNHRQPVGTFGVRSVKTWMEVDCQEGSYREKLLMVFNGEMATGTMLRNTAPGTQKLFPEPGSPQANIARWLCDR